MEQKNSDVELEEGAALVNDAPGEATPGDVASSSRSEFATTARAVLSRIRAGLTADRLLAGLCVVTALVLAAPWVQVPVAQLIDRKVVYSVPDLLATGQVIVDRAQSLQDVGDDVRLIAKRAADIVERSQDVVERTRDAAERVSDLREERS